MIHHILIMYVMFVPAPVFAATLNTRPAQPSARSCRPSYFYNYPAQLTPQFQTALALTSRREGIALKRTRTDAAAIYMED